MPLAQAWSRGTWAYVLIEGERDPSRIALRRLPSRPVEAVSSAAKELDVSVTTESDFKAIAVAVGELWAREIVDALRTDDREIIGAWPGTLGEARMRIRVAVRSRLELHVVEELARVAYLAARGGWQAISKADPES